MRSTLIFVKEIKKKMTHGGKREGSGRKKRDTATLWVAVSRPLLEVIAKKMTVKERNDKLRDFLQKLANE